MLPRRSGDRSSNRLDWTSLLNWINRVSEMAAIHAGTATLSWIDNVTVTAAPPVLFPMPSGLPRAQTTGFTLRQEGSKAQRQGQILLQKSLMVCRNGDSVAVMRF